MMMVVIMLTCNNGKLAFEHSPTTTRNVGRRSPTSVAGTRHAGCNVELKK